MRAAIFHPQALTAIRGFTRPARRAIGEAILDLQHGARLTMPLSRPMSAVAPGVQELRVRGRDGICRVMYLLTSGRGVLVFHAFEKKTQKTPPHEIAVARKRLRELLDD